MARACVSVAQHSKVARCAVERSRHSASWQRLATSSRGMCRRVPARRLAPLRELDTARSRWRRNILRIANVPPQPIGANDDVVQAAAPDGLLATPLLFHGAVVVEVEEDRGGRPRAASGSFRSSDESPRLVGRQRLVVPRSRVRASLTRQTRVAPTKSDSYDFIKNREVSLRHGPTRPTACPPSKVRPTRRLVRLLAFDFNLTRHPRPAAPFAPPRADEDDPRR